MDSGSGGRKPSWQPRGKRSVAIHTHRASFDPRSVLPAGGMGRFSYGQTSP